MVICFLIFSVEVILRAEAVEHAQAGDKCDFTGTLIVVPDIAQLSTPGMVAAILFAIPNGREPVPSGKEHLVLPRDKLNERNHELWLHIILDTVIIPWN